MTRCRSTVVMDARQLPRRTVTPPVEHLTLHLKQEVRKAPREATLRTFLFQMFCVFGEWDRALTQLNVAAELDPARDCRWPRPIAPSFAAKWCEKGCSPARTHAHHVRPSSEPWVPLLVEANRALAGGKFEAAAGLRDQAFEQADAVAGNG